MSWRSTLGFVLSAALLYWILHDQPWGEVAAALRSSNLPLWAVTVVVSQLMFPLRAIRWPIILHPVAPTLKFGPSWRAVAIGMMMNNVALARVGEPARAFVLSREVPHVPFTTAIGSLVVDRAFDALVVLTLLLVAVLDPAFGTHTEIGGKSLGASIALPAAGVALGFAVLFLAVFSPLRLERATAAVARRLLPWWAGRITTLVHNLTAGFSALRDPRRFLLILAWTFAHWLANPLAFWLGFRAMGIDVPFTAALLTQGLIAIAVAAPQAPGFFGAFEAAAVISLGLYGVAQPDAIAWALTFHILSFIPITVIGIYYLSRLGLSFRDLGRSPRDASAA
jgi:uncharacterized protein (TIRG00374 family)